MIQGNTHRAGGSRTRRGASSPEWVKGKINGSVRSGAGKAAPRCCAQNALPPRRGAWMRAWGFLELPRACGSGPALSKKFQTAPADIFFSVCGKRGRMPAQD